MIFERHYTPNECHVFPSLVIYAAKCKGCPDTHAWQFLGQFLWWGFTATFGVDEEKSK
jgi:hypothetical protein